MPIDSIKEKEAALRQCFKNELHCLNVDGDNDVHKIKEIKMYGALWHYVHELLLAEEADMHAPSGIITVHSAGGK